MAEVAWGEQHNGVRFGVRPPAGDVEAGGTITLELLCENRNDYPVSIFGFQPNYPRSLRVSPPKSHRPWIRVSFGDVNVLHPPEAFVRVLPRGLVTTGIDLSFAFDRRGAGQWPVAFGYDTVRAGGRLTAYEGPREGGLTGIAQLVVTWARSLRSAGIDEMTEARLDAALMSGTNDVVDQLRAHGEGGATFAARRIARILSSGAESLVGWRALDALALLGPLGREAVAEARAQLPHAEDALAFADELLARKAGEPTAQGDLPFVTTLGRIIDEPASRGNFLLSWTACDSEIHGTRRLQVFGNGERVVTGRAPSHPMALTRRSMLQPMQMQALVESLRYGAIWLLRPLRGVGLPDEPRPSLEVQLALGGPFGRHVAMWNGEWRNGPAATLADLLDRLSLEAAPDSMLPPAP